MAVASGISWARLGNTPVAIFEEHHHALIPWSRWTRTSGPARLVTIDHHCDTHEAFLRASFDGVASVDRARQKALLAAIDPNVEKTIEQAIALLRHDEHIDAAVRAGIVDVAFVINQQNQRQLRSVEESAWIDAGKALGPTGEFIHMKTVPRPEPPMTYAMPADRMVAVDPTYYRRGSDLVQPWPDAALESEHLDDRLAIYDQILRSAGEPPLAERPYILDIDMDAFRTLRSLRPDHPSTFHGLISGAIGITVALERDCCTALWLDDTPIDHAANEATLRRHLADALA